MRQVLFLPFLLLLLLPLGVRAQQHITEDQLVGLYALEHVGCAMDAPPGCLATAQGLMEAKGTNQYAFLADGTLEERTPEGNRSAAWKMQAEILVIHSAHGDENWQIKEWNDSGMVLSWTLKGLPLYFRYQRIREIDSRVKEHKHK